MARVGVRRMRRGGAGRRGGEDVPFFVKYHDPSMGEERNREGECDVDGDHDDDGRNEGADVRERRRRKGMEEEDGEGGR